MSLKAAILALPEYFIRLQGKGWGRRVKVKLWLEQLQGAKKAGKSNFPAGKAKMRFGLAYRASEKAIVLNRACAAFERLVNTIEIWYPT